MKCTSLHSACCVCKWGRVMTIKKQSLNLKVYSHPEENENVVINECLLKPISSVHHKYYKNRIVKYFHLLRSQTPPGCWKQAKNVKTCSYQPVLQVCKHESRGRIALQTLRKVGRFFTKKVRK